MAVTLVKQYDFAGDPDIAIGTIDFRKKAGQYNKLLNDAINVALQALSGGDAVYYAQGTDTTDADGDIIIDATGEFSAIKRYTLDTINPADAGVSLKVERFYDFLTITGDITTASLVALETLTEGTSGATAKLFLASALTVGTDRTVIMRLLSGTADGDKVWSGASGEITAVAVPAATSAYMGGRVFTTSTGASLDSTAISVDVEALGTAA